MLAATLYTIRPGLPSIKIWTHQALRKGFTLSARTYFSTSSLRPLGLKTLHSSKACSCYSPGLLQRPNGVSGLLLPVARCSGQYSRSEVTKDVLIYKNDKGTFFKILGAFAFAQLVFWTYLTHTAYLTMRDTDTYVNVKYGEEGPPEEVKNWRSWSGVRMKLNSGMWRYAITLLSIGAGSIIFIASFVYSRKSVYRIVLRKGGEDVTIQTYGLFSLPWRFTTSLNNVSCEHSRQGVRQQLPIKVRGHRLFYIVDKDGKFYNARMFDHSVGMHRIIWYFLRILCSKIDKCLRELKCLNTAILEAWILKLHRVKLLPLLSKDKEATNYWSMLLSFILAMIKDVLIKDVKLSWHPKLQPPPSSSGLLRLTGQSRFSPFSHNLILKNLNMY